MTFLLHCGPNTCCRSWCASGSRGAEERGDPLSTCDWQERPFNQWLPSADSATSAGRLEAGWRQAGEGGPAQPSPEMALIGRGRAEDAEPREWKLVALARGPWLRPVLKWAALTGPEHSPQAGGPGGRKGLLPWEEPAVGSAQAGEQAGGQDMEREPGPLD